MSRLRWPDSTNSVSEKPGTIHLPPCELTPQLVEADLRGDVSTHSSFVRASSMRCNWLRLNHFRTITPTGFLR